MRWITILGGGAGVALLAGTLHFAGVGRISFSDVILSGTPFGQLALLVLAVAVAVLAVLALINLPRRSAAPPDALFAIALAAPALGLLIGAYEGLVIQQAAARLHVTNMMVVAPSLAAA